MNFLRKKPSPTLPRGLVVDTFTPPAPLQTAVLCLVFNRPDTTAQVFDAIRKAKPPRLYVAADGPRADREGEAERVARVREIATAVDWQCEVKTLFQKENLGCKYGPQTGITWFFEHEEQGIVLEDDCLPHLDFFYFCQWALEEFKNVTDIWHINGNNFAISQEIFQRDTVCFSSLPQVWGWATWADRWNNYEPNPFYTRWIGVFGSHIDGIRSNFSVSNERKLSR